jgi:transcriptional regulator with XRE-family HTH domain
MADAAGVSEAAMSYFVRGVRQPSLAVAKRIADKLGVTVDELLTEN